MRKKFYIGYLTLFMTGIASIEPITGTLRRKFIITGKNPLKQNTRSQLISGIISTDLIR